MDDGTQTVEIVDRLESTFYLNKKPVHGEGVAGDVPASYTGYQFP